MRITRVSTVVVGAEMRNWVFVKLETDEGKSLGVPVWRLLGGHVREEVRLYDDLELGQHQHGQGQRLGLERQPGLERELVAHLEGADEDVHLAIVGNVVEEEPARAVHGAERLVGGVALGGEELRHLSPSRLGVAKSVS